MGYLATGRKSVTALIPLFFGLIFVGLGLVGGSTVAYVALGLAAVGFLGTARSLASLLKGERGAATVSKACMAGLCLAFALVELL